LVGPAFARTLSGVYGLVLLALHIRIQVNLVGKYLYLDSMNGDLNNEVEPPFQASTQKRYLAFAEYLLQDGLRGLVTFIEDATETVVGPVALSHQLSYDDVLMIILTIRRSIESKFDRLLECLLPSEKEDSEEEDTKLSMLLSETRNILESPSFRFTLKQCLDRAFLHLTRNLRLSFVLDEHIPNDYPEDKILLPTPLVEMAMAKLLPCINKQYSFALQTPHNELVIALSSFGPLQEFNYSVFTGS
jgi:peroxin-3